MFLGMRVRMQRQCRLMMFNGVGVPSIVVTRPEGSPSSSPCYVALAAPSPALAGSGADVQAEASSMSTSSESSISGLAHHTSLPNIESYVDMLAVPVTDARGRVQVLRPRPRPASVPSSSSDFASSGLTTTTTITSSSNSTSTSDSAHTSTSESDDSGLGELGYVVLGLGRTVEGDGACLGSMSGGLVVCACEACTGKVEGSGGSSGEAVQDITAAPVTRGTDVDFGIAIDGSGMAGASSTAAAEAPRPQSQVRWLDSIDDETYVFPPSRPSLPRTGRPFHLTITRRAPTLTTTPTAPTLLLFLPRLTRSKPWPTRRPRTTPHRSHPRIPTPAPAPRRAHFASRRLCLVYQYLSRSGPRRHGHRRLLSSL